MRERIRRASDKACHGLVAYNKRVATLDIAVIFRQITAVQPPPGLPESTGTGPCNTILPVRAALPAATQEARPRCMCSVTGWQWRLHGGYMAVAWRLHGGCMAVASARPVRQPVLHAMP